MASYRIFGESLVSEDEFARKGREILQLASAPRESGLPSVTLDDKAVLSPFSFAPDMAAAPIEFPPVGFGKPMTIDIRSVYTGHVGSRPFLSRTGDIAVVSGVKNWSEYNATARALNWVKKKTGKRALLAGPSAVQEGTRVVAYQKAIATSQLIATFEIVAAPPEDDVLDEIGAAFSAAAGVPLFLPYAGALIAAGQIVPLAGKLMDALTGGPSPWSQTEELTVDLPGYPPLAADFRVVAPATSNLHGLKYKPNVGLMKADGSLYDGDEPYVVIAIYGGERVELEGFTPAVMAADMARRFYPSKTGVGAAIGDVMEIAQVASDWKYRGEALKLKPKIDALGQDDPERAKLQTRYDALVANISNTDLTPH
ncbi:hypothetical protein SAMN05518801_107213 [Novosphingobium sp. CF614]|uniref:hypothetical protein n=1 Tax=Novosphingobium sp. CF614 TaxID=1884364 RepID=UPI0008EA436F|nr:hypothetical protein [Novosphingobium sp. CF614]SFG11684.1 hypothetical protein SAMN05518801_107213 [Novosphingobium sp. CF614]